ncbi:MAG: ankyrin repeat domain-containing protein [Planctomycetota bacterium]|nr:ankyrin repeat domain-containing protein [Planctomycetota bacterium]
MSASVREICRGVLSEVDEAAIDAIRRNASAVNEEFKFRWRPLEMALARGRSAAVVRALLEAGASLSAPDHYSNAEGMTIIDAALHRCPWPDEGTDWLEKLLDAGMPADFRLDRGITLLMWAAISDLGVLKLLIDRGADLNARSEFGWTALMFAAELDGWHGDHDAFLEIPRLLLGAGADPWVRCEKGKTALDWTDWYEWNDEMAEKVRVMLRAAMARRAER